MPSFLYRSPNMRLNVQGWVADDPTESDDDGYEAVTCLACRRVHLVNPKTEKVLGEDEEWEMPRPTRPGAKVSSRLTSTCVWGRR
jgi:hypothetical protein